MRKEKHNLLGGFSRRLVAGAFGVLAAALLLAAPLDAQRAERPGLNITGYVIDAELDTLAHHLTAKAVVSFTAPANLEVVNFGFHPALKVTKITDESGKLLEGERTADGAARESMMKELGTIRDRLDLSHAQGCCGTPDAIERVAAITLEELGSASPAAVELAVQP